MEVWASSGRRGAAAKLHAGRLSRSQQFLHVFARCLSGILPFSPGYTLTLCKMCKALRSQHVHLHKRRSKKAGGWMAAQDQSGHLFDLFLFVLTLVCSL